MLRSLGVPARIATGYVPSERDEIAGVWISRARDAHAWVEVWFPSYGWVSFDPTASVPLAGETPSHTIGGELVQALIAVVVDHVTLIVGALLGVAIARGAVPGDRRRGGSDGGAAAGECCRIASSRPPSPEGRAELTQRRPGRRVRRRVGRHWWRARSTSARSHPTWHDDERRFHDTATAVAVLERDR